MITPFSLSIAWMRIYLRELLAGKPDADCRRVADSELAITGKQFARCKLANGESLTIPVEGGASVLKRRNANPQLSGHGKWKREHLGAWNALYGKFPYFQYLMPEIEEVYSRYNTGDSLEQFNSALLNIVLDWIEAESVVDTLRNENCRKEFDLPQIEDDSLSVFNLLFREGKRSVFGLIWI